MKVTAKQVAERAGVSPATVSLVLRGLPGVGADVRARVRAARCNSSSISGTAKSLQTHRFSTS